MKTKVRKSEGYERTAWLTSEDRRRYIMTYDILYYHIMPYGQRGPPRGGKNDEN